MIYFHVLVLTYGEVCDFKEECEESNDEENQLLEKNPVHVVLDVPEQIFLIFSLYPFQPSEDNFYFGLTHFSSIVNK